MYVYSIYDAMSATAVVMVAVITSVHCTIKEGEEMFSYRVAAYSYRTVVEHALVVRIFTHVSSSAPIVKQSMKC
jgi:hypothetical protein